MYLGLFLWSLMVEVVEHFINMNDLDVSIFSTSPITLPLLFLYVVKTLNIEFERWYVVFFFPFVLDLTGIAHHFLFYAFHIFLLFYMLHILRKHKEGIGDYYSDLADKTLSWIKRIAYIFLFFHSLWIVEDVLGVYNDDITHYFAVISTVLTLLMIYWVGYNGFSQPEIFHVSASMDDPDIEEEVAAGAVMESDDLEPMGELEVTPHIVPESTDAESDVEPSEVADDEEEAEDKEDETTKVEGAAVFQELSDKVRQNKLFLQKDITIRDLSRQLNVNEKVFSRLIKDHTGKNFYHYINQFRVKEFKRLLSTPKAHQLSLIGLSEEAGFYSKSTFYSVFKKMEGITPKQYYDQINKSE